MTALPTTKPQRHREGVGVGMEKGRAGKAQLQKCFTRARHAQTACVWQVTKSIARHKKIKTLGNFTRPIFNPINHLSGSHVPERSLHGAVHAPEMVLSTSVALWIAKRRTAFATLITIYQATLLSQH